MEQDAGDPNRPDIASTLAALRREAYSRSGTEASFAALRSLEAQLEEQLTARRADVISTAPSTRAPAGEAPAGEAPADEAPAGPPTPTVLPRRRLHGSGKRIGIVAVAAIVVAAVGFSFGRISPAVTAPSTSAATPTLPAESVHGSATLALLETAQRPADIPPFTLGSDIIPGSVHVLPTGLQGQLTIYGARTYQHLVCLVAVSAIASRSSLGDSALTCASVHEFVTDGIRLRVSTNELVTDDAGFSDFAYFQYLWTGNGEISFMSNHYPLPAAPNF